MYNNWFFYIQLAYVLDESKHVLDFELILGGSKFYNVFRLISAYDTCKSAGLHNIIYIQPLNIYNGCIIWSLKHDLIVNDLFIQF